MIATTWRKAGAYVLLAIPALGLGGISAIAKQSQDSGAQQDVDAVAAAARKAREQRRDAPKAKKVYTDDDLGGAGVRPAATTTPTAGTPATSEAKAAATSQTEAALTSPDKTAGADKNDEAAWRKKFQEARAKLADAEKELDILQREAQKAQVQYYSDPQKAMKEQYSRKDVADKDAKIAAKKQEIEQMKQHISDMEDDLRRAGGDLGWSRE
jgi:chromosome segregation ATPase